MSSEINYEDLGFKCGIEIHQRLDTDTKLFCNCPPSEGEQGKTKVTRKLRPVPSEMGEVDRAAKFEYLKKRLFSYDVYVDVSCLVELDEEPPHELTEDVLDITLQICKMLDCKVPREIHPMRKTVIDGSNTSGFQRTMLVGLNGHLETEKGTVEIPNVCLEEESAQILGEENGRVEYGLDRLGIPLIEIGTSPDIVSPEHAREVAEKIGSLLRSTGRVQRGIGTIRQDVNVSIEEGARIEVKGLQELDIVEDVVRNEAKRQRNLVQLKDELGAVENPDDGYKMDVEHVFENTENGIIQDILSKDRGKVVAFKLTELEGYMNEELCPGLTLGKELSYYAEAQGPKGIIHSDEDVSKYGLEEEFEQLSEELDKEDGEVIVLIAEEDPEVVAAAQAVEDRARKLTEEVPEETRVAMDDGTTKYLRPLPGEARMYPETDVPPVTVPRERMESVEVPESLEERKKGLMDDYGLSEHLAEEVLESSYFQLFIRSTDEFDLNPTTVADILTTTLKDLKKRENVSVEKLTEDDMEIVLENLEDGNISRDSVNEIVKKITEEDRNVEEVIEEIDIMSDKELRQIIEEVVDDRKDVLSDERAAKKLMGPVMSKVQGRASGEKVSKELRKYIEEVKE